MSNKHLSLTSCPLWKYFLNAGPSSYFAWKEPTTHSGNCNRGYFEGQIVVHATKKTDYVIWSYGKSQEEADFHQRGSKRNPDARVTGEFQHWALERLAAQGTPGRHC